MSAPESEASVVFDPALMALDTAEFVGSFLDATGAPDMVDAHASLYDLIEGPGAVAKEGYYAPLLTPDEAKTYQLHQLELVRRVAARFGMSVVDAGEVTNNG